MQAQQWPLVRSNEMKYTIIESENHSPVVMAETENGQILYIPMDEANSDYQAYLKNLEEGTAQQPEGNI